jgi:quinol monooxygenase YgiN
VTQPSSSARSCVDAAVVPRDLGSRIRERVADDMAKPGVVEYIRYQIAADKAEAFERAYAGAHVPLGRSPHCLGYDVSRCVEAPSSYIVRIEWDSAEGHLEGFQKGPDFPAFLALVRPFFEDIEEMRHYELTPASSGSDS